MNARERFNATIQFRKVDRPFRWETPAVWPSTIKRWKNEGLPADIFSKNITDSAIYDYFSMDKLVWLPFAGSWTRDPYAPMFEKTVLGSDDHYVITRDGDGIVKKNKKDDPDTSMPQFLEFPVASRSDYTEKIKWRLDFRSRERFPANWQALCRAYAGRDYPVGQFIIGPFGHLRNLMGDENLMYQFFDDPEFIHEIMANWRNFYQGFIRLVCQDVLPDFIMIWEDMCYKMGPLVSPDLYREFMSPYLDQVIRSARACGIDGIVVDNDGDCRKMLPIYLDCGANAFYPFEVQAGMDVLAIRKEYGKRFAIIGGIDKRVLAEDPAAIRAEVDRVVPAMLESGGYIPMTDHSIPNNVSLEMFRYFIDYVRHGLSEVGTR